MHSIYTYRPIDERDVRLIAAHRHLMFAEAGHDPSTMDQHFTQWLEPRIADDRYFGWIATIGDEPVGGAGMMVLDWPPHPRHPDQDRRGYILNVFVEPEHRRRGVAGALMAQTYAEARARGITYLVLHASEQGRPLYERDGWSQTNEMALTIR
jgi:GNAT superfamily N-acetyltransferase